MIRERAEGPVDGVEFAGIEAARPAARGARGDRAAPRAIVIGPSNPVISIRPILAVPGMRDALRATRGAGRRRLADRRRRGASRARPRRSWRWAGRARRAAGTARAYGDVLDGIVADEPVDGLPALVTDTLMADAAARRRVAGRRPALRGESAA